MSGKKYVNNTDWYPTSGGTCYRFHAGVRDSYNAYRRSIASTGYTILEFDEFDWGEECFDGTPSFSFDELIGIVPTTTS